MQQSKLIHHLKLLSAEELKRFASFVRSPYYTQSKDVIRLFNLLRKHHPHFSNKQVTKDRIFKRLFPKETYSDIKLRNLQSKLNKVVENYLLQLTFEQDEIAKRKALAKLYQQRNYTVAFQRATEQLLDDLDFLPFRDADYFLEKYGLERALYFWESPNSKKAVWLNKAYDSLAAFSRLERLRLTLYQKNRGIIYANQPTKVNLFYNDNDLTQLYEKFLDLLEKPTLIAFEDAKISFFKNKEKLRKEDQQSLLVVLINHAKLAIRTEQTELEATIFSLYKLGIEEEILFDNGTLNEILFINIVMFGSKLTKFTWVEDFLQKYATRITGNNSKEIATLGKAIYHFFKKNYTQATHLLATLKFDNKLLELSARTLSLRCFYELFSKDSTLYDYLLAALQAYQKFLERDLSFHAEKVIAYQNFSKLLAQLIPAQLKMYGSREKAVLLQLLATTKPLTAASWLREKIEAIR
ncbi:MAG: hypothetical protein AAF960_01395 [Bacteroidota bacterium]